jgi:hypothetical protein
LERSEPARPATRREQGASLTPVSEREEPERDEQQWQEQEMTAADDVDDHGDRDPDRKGSQGRDRKSRARRAIWPVCVRIACFCCGERRRQSRYPVYASPSGPNRPNLRSPKRNMRAFCRRRRPGKRPKPRALSSIRPRAPLPQCVSRCVRHQIVFPAALTPSTTTITVGLG